jgi:hypothetical protein
VASYQDKRYVDIQYSIAQYTEQECLGLLSERDENSAFKTFMRFKLGIQNRCLLSHINFITIFVTIVKSLFYVSNILPYYCKYCIVILLGNIKIIDTYRKMQEGFLHKIREKNRCSGFH